MIPQHRRIILLTNGRGREPGGLHYSGFRIVHPEARGLPPEQVVAYFLVFWFWVPEGQRRTWGGRSHVPDASIAELAMLASGELEEVRRDIVFPRSMARDVALQLVRDAWDVLCERRLGHIPEQYRRAHVGPALMPDVQRLEQQRNAIQIVSG